ncbi:MAG: hypothetical protein MUO50_10750 [Longimicrobiales bacterium]|nr:hypothetical protein [Longimicrobiales bacterium]
MSVSSGGGTEPVWGNNGRELFYRNAGGDMVFVGNFLEEIRARVGR